MVRLVRLWLLPPLILLALLLEGLYVWTARTSGAYPKITAFKGKPCLVAAKGLNLALFPLKAEESGLMRLDFYGRPSSKAGERVYFGFISEKGGRLCLDMQGNEAGLRQAMEQLSGLAKKDYASSCHANVCCEVSAGESLYFAAAQEGDEPLSAMRLFFYVTSWRLKLRALLPLCLFLARNAVLSVLLFLAFLLFLPFCKGPCRIFPFMAGYALALTLLCLTPCMTIAAFSRGPLCRSLSENQKPLKLQGSEVVKIPVTNILAYGACRLSYTAKGGSREKPIRLYSDLYKAPAYDDFRTENCAGLDGGTIRRELFFNAVSAYEPLVSLRFWLDGGRGEAEVSGYRLQEFLLPPMALVFLQKAGAFLEEAYFSLLAGGLVAILLLALFLCGGFLGRLGVVCAAFLCLAFLFGDTWKIGAMQPLVTTDSGRHLAGIETFRPHYLVWNMKAKSGVDTSSKDFVPQAGAVCVSDAANRVLGVNNSVYPTEKKGLLRFFPREISDIRISVREGDTLIDSLGLYRISSGALALRGLCWLGLALLVGGGLLKAGQLILGGRA